MIHLHVHDKKGSLLDSILDVKQIVAFAKENKQEAIAITNHGTMFSYVDFYKEAIKQNVKPIVGCEVYEVDDMNFKNDTKDFSQKRYHLILLAKNQKGLQNLYKIVSDSYTIGMYKKPRIDIDYIKNNNFGEGIICCTACQAGRLSRYLVNGEDESKVVDYLDSLKNTFEHVYLEIQAHDTESEINSNNKILYIANKYNFKYVVTTDAHMLKKEDLDTHSIFVQIGEGREVGETYTDCYLQTDEDVHEKLDKYYGYDVVQKAIDEIMSTFYRQTLFAEYEYLANEHVAKNLPVNHEVLSNIMVELYDESGRKYIDEIQNSESFEEIIIENSSKCQPDEIQIIWLFY